MKREWKINRPNYKLHFETKFHEKSKKAESPTNLESAADWYAWLVKERKEQNKIVFDKL